MRAIFLFLAVGVLFLPGRFVGDAQLQESTGDISPDVLAALETAGEVEVIIHLVAPALPPPDQLTPDTLEAYRQQVAAVQDRVLAKLTAADFTLTHRYSVSAALAGRITATGVEKLRGHPDVTIVSLDAPLSPIPVKPGPIRLGDANCDGEVTSIDALLVLQFDAGIIWPDPNEELYEIADLNDDGLLNSLDATLILQFHAGLIDRL